MWRANRVALALALLLALALPAHAYFLDGTPGVKNGSATPISPNNPTGAINTGDTLVEITACANASDLATTSAGWTQVVPTGGDAGNNLTYNSGNGKVAAFYATYNGSTPALSLTTTINAGSCTSLMLAAYGLDPSTPIGLMKGSSNPSSLIIGFPTFTPSSANSEALFIGAGSFGTGTSLPFPSGTMTTCGITTDEFQNTSYNAETAANPVLYWQEANQGPCAPTLTTPTSWTISGGTAAANIGVVMTLKAAPFALVQPSVFPNKFRNMAGVFDDLHQQQSRNSWNLADYQNTWLDGWTAYTAWSAMEPSNCDEYMPDWMDNMILNARIMGKKVVPGFGAGTSLLCGGAHSVSCTGFGTAGSIGTLNVSTMPAWAAPPSVATTCNGSHTWTTNDYITSMWTGSSSGPPNGNDMIEMDAVGTAYQAEFDRFIAAMGTRYAGINNIVGVYAQSSSADGANNSTQTVLDNGADGATITCNGATCTSICGANPCNRTLNDAAQWLALTPVGGGTYSSANTGTCGGGASNQPWVACDMVLGQQHFDASWTAAFSQAALDQIIVSHTAPRGTFTGTPDQFQAQMFPLDLANYAGVIEEQANGLGCVNTGCSMANPPPYIPYANQPFNGIGWQEILGLHNVAAAPCNTAPNYSFSSTNCVPPAVYEGILHSQNPHIEYFVADIEDAPSRPWIILNHQVALRSGGGPWTAPISSPSQSQIMMPTR